jgi:hypothetical protein
MIRSIGTSGFNSAQTSRIEVFVFMVFIVNDFVEVRYSPRMERLEWLSPQAFGQPLLAFSTRG